MFIGILPLVASVIINKKIKEVINEKANEYNDYIQKAVEMEEREKNNFKEVNNDLLSQWHRL